MENNMIIDWENIKKEHLYDERLYKKILSISDDKTRQEQEDKLRETARKFRELTPVSKKYEAFVKKQKRQQKEDEKRQKIKERELYEEQIASAVIDFGENAPIREMKAPRLFS